MDKIYVHYGNDVFQPELIGPDFNMFRRNKPKNVLWASAIDAPFGWKKWCQAEEFHLEKLKKSFRFTLTKNANILIIDSVQAEKKLPLQKNIPEEAICIGMSQVIKPYDFDYLRKTGVDVIDVRFSGEKARGLRREMPTWDCDSIVVLNPQVVQVIENKK